MKKYYDILGIRHGAPSEEIRRAYRRLAMLYHPDRNSAPEASHKFLLIKDAYEKLMNPVYSSGNSNGPQHDTTQQAEAERRERVYKVWVEHQQKQARYRQAYGHAYYQTGSTGYGKKYQQTNKQTSEEENTPLVRWLHTITNLFFMGLFAGILLVPIYKYFEQQSLPVEKQRSILFFIIPALLGVLFLCYGYYYWFKDKTEK